LLWLAGLTTAYSLFILIIGIQRGRDGAALIASGNNAALASGALLTLTSFLLFYNLAASNFRVEYVSHYTSRELPLFYKLSAFWGGQQGSLLLWAWLLSLFTVAVLLIYQRKNLPTLPYVIAILMAMEKRLNVTHEQPTTEVALLSTWRDDLYLVLAGYDEEKQEAMFSAYVNPLVVWLWIGGWVMALGTLLAMVPLSRQAQTIKRETRERAPNKPPAQNLRKARRREEALAAH